jgi:mediator of RNA polymerase II transcription subunit 5
MFSLSVYLSSFLQAARSPELHHAPTLDMLCRIALDAHITSGSPLVAPIQSPSDSLNVSNALQDVLFLFRTAHSISISSSSSTHRLTSSVSQLLILLFSGVTDPSPFSHAQAVVLCADANDILQTMQLPDDIRHVLDTFVLSLGFLINDDAKIVEEAQMLQSMHLALGKVDFLDASSDTDIMTCTLVLQHLVRPFSHMVVPVITFFFFRSFFEHKSLAQATPTTL